MGYIFKRKIRVKGKRNVDKQMLYLCRKTKLKCEVYQGKNRIPDCDEAQHIAMCPSCGYIFVANPPSLEQTTNLYRTITNHDKGATEKLRNFYQNKSRRRHRFILDTIGSAPTIQTVLEIGAVSGANLNLYKEMGLNVFGTELSPRNVEYAKQQFGIELYNMDFFNFYKTNSAKYDLVMMSHVLEHIIDPCTVIKQILSINNKYMFIEVPGFDYNYLTVPYSMFIPTDLSYFTLESLKKLMNQANYRIVNASLLPSCKSRPPVYNSLTMTTMWEKLQDGDARRDEAMLEPVISSEQQLDLYIERSQIFAKEVAAAIDRIPDDLRLAVYSLSKNNKSVSFNKPGAQKTL